MKINTGYEYISFSKKPYNGQQVYETRFSITDYHENANKKKTQGDIFSKLSNGYLHKRQETKVVEDVEKRELFTVDGNVKWCSNYWATVCRLLKKLS